MSACTVPPACQGEGRLLGGRGGEGLLPRRLEINGIDQDESGRRVERTLREEIVDLVVGRRRRPSIDASAGGFGGGHVVDEVHPGAEPLRQGVQERLLPRRAPLSPQGVGDVQGDVGLVAVGLGLGSGAAGEGRRQRSQPGIEIVDRQPAQDGKHLGRGLAAGTVGRHRERRCHRIGRADEVVGTPCKDRDDHPLGETGDGFGGRVRRAGCRGGSGDLRHGQVHVCARSSARPGSGAAAGGSARPRGTGSRRGAGREARGRAGGQAHPADDPAEVPTREIPTGEVPMCHPTGKGGRYAVTGFHEGLDVESRPSVPAGAPVLKVVTLIRVTTGKVTAEESPRTRSPQGLQLDDLGGHGLDHPAGHRPDPVVAGPPHHRPGELGSTVLVSDHPHQPGALEGGAVQRLPSRPSRRPAGSPSSGARCAR